MYARESSDQKFHRAKHSDGKRKKSFSNVSIFSLRSWSQMMVFIFVLCRSVLRVEVSDNNSSS